MVLHLEILVGLFVKVEVGDGAYIAGLGLHEDGAAPLGMTLSGLGEQGVLNDILEIGVNSRDDIQTVLRFLFRHGLIASADTLDRTHAIDAPQLFVETLLETGVTFAVIPVDTTDSTAGEVAEWFDAAVLVFKEDTGFILAFLDERVEFEFAALQVVDAVVANPESFLASEVRLRDARLVIRLRVVAYDNSQIAREGVDMRGKECTVLLVQRRYARVHIHIILRHTGGKQLTVAVEDVASRSLNRLAGRHLFLRHLQPGIPFDCLDIDDLNHHSNEAAQDEREDDRETPDRISLFVTHG